MFMATQGLFICNDKLYKLIDGMTMGSPLRPGLHEPQLLVERSVTLVSAARSK